MCLAVACASSSGRYVRIKPGDNLYRIGQRYGVSAETIARENGIDDVTNIQVGQVIWVPDGDGRRSAPSTQASSGAPPRRSSSEARQAARAEARRSAELSFAWPVKGADLTSRFGRRDGADRLK